MVPIGDLDPSAYPRDYYAQLRALPVEERFRREALAESPGASVSARDVYDAYVRYCFQRQVAPQKALVLSRYLEGASIERGVTVDGKVWRNVSLCGR